MSYHKKNNLELIKLKAKNNEAMAKWLHVPDLIEEIEDRRADNSIWMNLLIFFIVALAAFISYNIGYGIGKTEKSIIYTVE